MKPVLSIKNLSKLFGNGCPNCFTKTGPEFETNVCPDCGTVVGCHNVEFDLYPGEFLGIVGESGSGKSTVLKMLNFDIPHTSGEVYLNTKAASSQFDFFKIKEKSDIRESLETQVVGKNLLEMNAFNKRQLRNLLMGIVYQNPHLGLKLNISSGGNIAEKLLMSEWKNVKAMRTRASVLLEKTEIPLSRLDDYPKNFSGGMQQRVQIAKALSNEPAILYLDEVTTGLDVSVQARVLDLIKQIQKDLNITTIVVSHDLQVIRLLTDRTIVMKYGRVVESGLTDQILEDPQHSYTQLLVNSQL